MTSQHFFQRAARKAIRLTLGRFSPSARAYASFLRRAAPKARLSRVEARPFGIDPTFPGGVDPNNPFGPDPDQPLGYEPELAHLLDRHMPRDGVFIDAGANIGYFSLYVAMSPGFSGHVHAFEPVERTFGYLGDRIAGFHLESFITRHNVALSDVIGQAFIAYHFSDHGSNRISEAGGDGETIKTTTLDSFHLDRVDFIKFDVEGHERFALSGARQTIARHKPFICVESTPDPDQPEIVLEALRLLEELGYTLLYPAWRQPGGRFIPCDVGRNISRRILALIPMTVEDRTTLPNFPQAGLNLFACPTARLDEIGVTAERLGEIIGAA